MSSAYTNPSVTVPWIKSQKGISKISMLTAYDYPTASILDEAGIDVLLVGDSLGTVIYGEPNTLSVTMDDMIRHTRAVSKAARRCLVVADLPFMSYQVSPEQAVSNAGRLLKEAGAQAVKLEGGLEMGDTVRAITRAGIPVMAHIGLTPQSIHTMGSYRMHGKGENERNYLHESAHVLSIAGAFSIVLECVDPVLSREITCTTPVPTIGIGSGSECDGQVLVINDLIGMTLGRVPRFVVPLADMKQDVRDAVRGYIQSVQSSEAGSRQLPNATPTVGDSHAPSH